MDEINSLTSFNGSYMSSQAGSSSQLYADSVQFDHVVTDKTADDNLKTIEKQQFSASYMHPTMSSSLPPYIQGEVERIRSSYRTGTFWSIKKLPSKLEPGTIQLTRKQHTKENLISNPENVFKPTSTSKNREVFHPQIYVGTDYDKVGNLNKNAVEEEKIRTDSYSRKPFVITSRIRGKNEDIFFDPEYRFPHEGGSNGVFKLESITRSDVLDQEKFLKGSMSAKMASQVRRWLRTLHDQLARDWPDYLFKVKFCATTDEVLVQFEKPNRQNQYLSTLNSHNLNEGEPLALNTIFPPPNNLLSKYMQKLATLGVAFDFGLRKRGDRWNVFEVDYPDLSPSLGEHTLPSAEHEEQRDTVSALKGSRSATADDKFNWYVPPAAGEDRDSAVPRSPANNRTVNFAQTNNTNNINSNSNNNADNKQPAISTSNAIADGIAAAAASTSAAKETSTRSPSFGFPVTKHNSLGDVVSDVIRSPSLRDLVVGNRASVRALVSKSDNSSVGSDNHSLDSGHKSVSKNGNLPSAQLDGGSLNSLTSSSVSTHTTLQHSNSKIPFSAKPQLQLTQSHLREDQFDDSKIYLLTYAFYAPWVNTGRLSTFKDTASRNREKANWYGVQFKKKYSLDVQSLDLASSEEQKAALLAVERRAKLAAQKKAVPTPISTAPDPNLKLSSNGAVNGYLHKFLEHDEYSFGGHSEDGRSPKSRKASTELSQYEESAVARAVGLVSGGTAGGGSVLSGTANNSTTNSGSTKMSIRKSLKSFSKSSFSHNNTLIYD